MELLFAEDSLEPDRRPAVLDDIHVQYREQKRFVKCFCGQEVHRSVVPHLKNAHPEVWQEWMKHFVELRGLGFPLKKIMRLYRAGNGPLLFSWTVIDRAFRNAIESELVTFNPVPIRAVATWEPADFQPANGTVWDFPERGNWAVHSGDYRGNWPPQLVRNLIVKFTEPGDVIVDPFVGGGTTLIEAWLCNRRSVGIDVSKLALQTTRAKINEMNELARYDNRVCLSDQLRPLILDGDSLSLTAILKDQGISLGTVDMVCAHPPYLDAIKYTDSDNRDLSQFADPTVFYEQLGKFAHEVHDILAERGICALLIGDVRKKGQLVPLGLNSAAVFQGQGLTLESIIIKTQHHHRSSEFYRDPGKYAFLLEHEYLLIFRK